MQYRILGPLEVVDNGTVLDLGPPKQRAVLGALLIEANRVVSLDRLIDELWGDDPPPQATASLQAYISHLRRLVEPDRQPRQSAHVLVTQPPGYVLRVHPDQIDAARFAALAAEGRQRLAEGSSAIARRLLQEALSLWRGPALADFAYEDFARTEAGRLEELRLAALEDRLEADIALGSHAAVVAELEQLVAAHRLRERLWGSLMVALYRCGRQADALRAYQRARRTLAEELGIDPGPALRRLEADILAQSPSLEWRPPAVEPRVPPTIDSPDDSASESSRGRTSPLVGRDQELAQLAAVLKEAASGRGGVVLVHGEAGIGKTRVAQELVAEAGARGFRSAWGRAYEGAGTPAFWPWVEVIRSLLGSCDRQVLEAAVGQRTAELAQVVPEVKEVTGTSGTSPPADPDTARFRLFEAFATFLRGLAAHRPLVVVLDDLQWADVASLDLLSFLGPRISDTSLVVVGTYRPAEVGGDHPLSNTLAALARHQVVGRVGLSGLTEADVGTLVSATTGVHAGPELVATVHARTGGNPFFVGELTRLLQVEHALSPDALARAVPAGVRDVVRRRLARLPEQTRTLLSLAAVAGREFELRVLETAADLDADQVLELVEAALAIGLVVEDSAVVGRCRFSHDLVRETIVDELSTLRRARLHARLAEALEALYGDDDERSVEVAHHFFHARSVGSPEKVITHALRASRGATARLAYEQAHELLHRALGVTRSLPRGTARDRRELEVLLPLSSLVTMTKGFAAAEAHDVLARALDLCEQLEESHEVVPVLWRLVSFHNVSAQLEASRHFADQLLEVARRSGQPAELVAAHHSVGVTALQQGELAEARHHLEAALALPDGLHDPWLASWLPQHPVVACSTFLAWTLALMGDNRRAQELAHEAVAFAHRLRHDFTTVHALLFDAWMSGWAGDFNHSRRRAEEGVRLALAKGFALYGGLSQVCSGWARAGQDEPEPATAEIADGLATMEETGAWMLHTFFLALLSEAQWRAAGPKMALETIERALKLAETTGERFYEAELHRLRGEIILAMRPEEVAEAEAEMLEAVSVAKAQGATMLELRAVDSLRRLAARSPSNC